MAKDSVIKMDGEITQELSNGFFRVQLDNGMDITCNLSGKMRQMYIKVVAGDRVSVEMSPYDLTKGRISFRHNVRTPQQDRVPRNSKHNKFKK